jgi:Carbohydrate family 9 binding domain-like
MRILSVIALFVLAAYDAPLRSYDCLRAPTPVQIDGRLDDPAWSRAPWTADFVDIEGKDKPAPRFRTRVKMLWDDRYFYVGAWLEEPHVWGTLVAAGARKYARSRTLGPGPLH